jgi:YLP motif-containing protein 1
LVTKEVTITFCQDMASYTQQQWNVVEQQQWQQWQQWQQQFQQWQQQYGDKVQF